MAERIYGLLGRKLGHSWSPAIHHALGCGSYRLIELEPDQLQDFLTHSDIGGLNVTIPYKRAIIRYLDEISDDAKEIGAVNGVRITADGRRIGYNTDVIGIRKTLSKHDLSGAKALILGTGGAAAAVEWVLRQMGVAYKCRAHGSY